jgi:hypothetical protein
MAAHRAAPPGSQQENVLRVLLDQQRLGRYAPFFVTGEGGFLPNGLEETSGYVIDERGRVFSFWLGWDHDHGVPALTEWEQEEPEPHWSRSREYREARAAVGLKPD